MRTHCLRMCVTGYVRVEILARQPMDKKAENNKQKMKKKKESDHESDIDSPQKR